MRSYVAYHVFGFKIDVNYVIKLTSGTRWIFTSYCAAIGSFYDRNAIDFSSS